MREVELVSNMNESNTNIVKDDELASATLDNMARPCAFAIKAREKLLAH